MENVTTPTPNPTMSLICFFVVTTSYFVIRSFTSKDNVLYRFYFAIYLFLLIIGELIINIVITKSMCKGTAQYETASMATFLPYAIIFGSLHFLLKSFPGWLRPFSNTFGYFFTKGAANHTINEIFESSESPDKFQNTLENIYKDSSLLFNELTSQNVHNFMDKMEKNVKTDNSKYPLLREKITNLVSTKESISEYIWYMLTGGLVTSASFNYIVNSKCNYSVQEMQKRDKNYVEKMEQNEKNKKEESENAKKYKSYE